VSSGEVVELSLELERNQHCVPIVRVWALKLSEVTMAQGLNLHAEIAGRCFEVEHPVLVLLECPRLLDLGVWAFHRLRFGCRRRVWLLGRHDGGAGREIERGRFCRGRCSGGASGDVVSESLDPQSRAS
jgi:hypothetical protein